MDFLKGKFDQEEAQFTEYLNAPTNRANDGYLTRLEDTVSRLKKAIEAGDHLLAAKACKAECEALTHKLTFALACCGHEGERRIVTKMIKKTALRCAHVVGTELSPVPFDTVLATHEKARALNERLVAKYTKAHGKYAKREGWNVVVVAYESPDDGESEGFAFDEDDEDAEWFCDVEWDETSETWVQVFRRTKPIKKTPSTEQPTAIEEGELKTLTKKLKTPENWAKLKENHRLAKQAKKLEKWGKHYQMRLNGQQPGNDALRKAYQKVYGDKTDIALAAVKNLQLKTAFASLKERFGINAYVKLRLGKTTDLHARWAALTFEQVQAQPEIQLANWRYYTRNWTVERKQKWANIKSTEEYKKATSPDAKKEYGKLSFLMKHTSKADAEKILAKYPGIEFDELLKKEEVQILTFNNFKATWSEKMRETLGNPKTYEEYVIAKKVRDHENLDRWFKAVFKDRANYIRALYPECSTPTEVWDAKNEEGRWRLHEELEVGSNVIPRLTFDRFIPLGLYPANYRPRQRSPKKVARPIIIETWPALLKEALEPETVNWKEAIECKKLDMATKELEIKQQTGKPIREDVPSEPPRDEPGDQNSAGSKQTVTQASDMVSSIWDMPNANFTIETTSPMPTAIVVVEGGPSFDYISEQITKIKTSRVTVVSTDHKDTKSYEIKACVTLSPSCNLIRNKVPEHVTRKHIKDLTTNGYTVFTVRSPTDMSFISKLKFYLNSNLDYNQYLCP